MTKTRSKIVMGIVTLLLLLAAALCVIPTMTTAKADIADDRAITYYSDPLFQTFYVTEASKQYYTSPNTSLDYLYFLLYGYSLDGAGFVTEERPLPCSFAGTGSSRELSVKTYMPENNSTLFPYAILELPELSVFENDEDYAEYADGKYAHIRFKYGNLFFYGIPVGNSGRYFLFPKDILNTTLWSIGFGSTLSASVSIVPKTEQGYFYSVVYRNTVLYCNNGLNFSNNNIIQRQCNYGFGGETITGYYVPFCNKYLTVEEMSSYTMRNETVFFAVSDTYDPRESIGLPENPTDPAGNGRTFFGWYRDSAFKVPYNGEPIEDNTQLYARFIYENPTFTFDTDGGNEIEPITVEYETLIDDIEIPTPVKAGYTFVEWYVCNRSWEIVTNNPKLSEFCPSGTPVTADFRLKAVYTVNTYTATFNPDNKQNPTTETVTFDSTFTIPSAPIKKGHTFLGWFDLLDNEVTEETVYIYPKNTTFTAKWQVLQYTVTFYVGNSIYATITVDYGTRLLTAAESANVTPTAYRMESTGVYSNNNLKDVIITDDISVEAEKTTAEKTKDFWTGFGKYIAIGGAAALVLIVLATVLSSSRRRYRRRRR